MRREDVADRHRAVGGLVDQPVVALDQGAGAVGGAGDGAHRRLCHTLRALHQPRAQPRVAQPRPAEFVARPGLGVEPVANRQRRHARYGRREAGAPRRLQGVHIHCLVRFRRRVRAVPAPAAAGLTHPNPVRRAPRSPPRVRPRRRTFPAARGGSRGDARSRRRPRVRPGPARARPSCGTGCRGVPAAGTDPAPGADGRAGPYRPTRPRCRGPAGRRAHAANPTPAQPAMRRTHQIPHLRTDKRTGSTRVLVRHQRVPDPTLRVGLHQRQRQMPDRADCGRHVYGRRHRVREHTCAAHTAARAPTSWQRDVAGRLQVGQCRAATRPLPPAAPIAEIERFTHAVGHLPKAANALRDRPVQHRAQSAEVAPKAAPDLILYLHAELQ